MLIKAKMANSEFYTKFFVRNYAPDEEATLSGAIHNIEDFENENSVIVDVEEVQVEQNETTQDYRFYSVETFNGFQYAEDKEENSLEDITEYVEFKYIAVPI